MLDFPEPFLLLGSVSKETIGQIRWLITQVKTQSTFDAFLRYH